MYQVIGTLHSVVVSRRRLATFAFRQGLQITADNGNVVIRYLAVTRRWRSSFLVLALVGTTVWQYWRDQHLTVNFLAAFAGWFVGMVIAEWRVDTLARRPDRSVASLEPRQLRSYLDLRLLALPLLAWFGVYFFVLLGILQSASDHDVLFALQSYFVGRFVPLSVGAVVAVAALVLVAHRIVTRPQPAAAPDLVAADNALRSRSLRVLCGSAFALAGYFGAALYDAITQRPVDAGTTPGFGVAGLVGYIALPILGVVLASAPVRTRQPEPVPA